MLLGSSVKRVTCAHAALLYGPYFVVFEKFLTLPRSSTTAAAAAAAAAVVAVVLASADV